MGNKGKLYVVSTPIGNMSDITLRAIDVLRRVSFILAEDTRHTKNLLNQYNISTKLVSYRDQNHTRMIDRIVEKLDIWLTLALVSDAGTPTISDPGYKLIRDVKNIGFEIISIPGASAVISALSVSGVSTDKFFFLGFLPKSDKKIRDILNKYSYIDSSIVIYESPHRVKFLLKTILDILGDRTVSIANDLTKLHEVVITNRVSQLVSDFPLLEKGEFVVII